jgi:two-component sensor histidine kinase
LAQSRERYLRLRALTSDNPRQQARFPELERHIQARLDLVDQTIAAMRTSPQEAVRIVRTSRGMRVEEIQLLATRSSYLEDIQRRTFAIILFVIGATAFVTLLLLGYLRANIRRYQHLVISLDRVTQYKDLLLKEIHHRLNNVLQLVYSIMQLQSRGLASAARQPFEQSLRRVRVVGRAHQSVYGTDSPSDVPVRTLLNRHLGRRPGGCGP